MAQDSDRSLADVLTNIGDDLGRLVRGEIALLKAEVRENATKVGTGVGMFGGAGLAGFFALEFLLLALLFGLTAAGLQTWLAALVVGVALAAVAGFLALRGKKSVSSASVMPVETMQQIKNDAAALKADVQRVRGK